MMSLRFLPGHHLTLLQGGAEFFPALIDAIRRAEHDIHIETYLFEDDPSGRAVANALVDAAQRGLRVRVLVDGFGSPSFSTILQPRLSGAGVAAIIYRPERSPFRFRRHRLRRLHRKLALIDRRIAFVGGINLIDDHQTGGHCHPGPRFDFAVRVEGPVVESIRQTMQRLWEVSSWVSTRRRFRFASESATAHETVGDQQAAFVIRDNFRHRRSIEKAYLSAIDKAKSTIIIANAYFLPGRRFRSALKRAAQRGVQVTLLLQGQIEYRLLHYATQALYRTLQRGGIRVFEYQHSFLHAKVAVIDAHWATVGSSNIDPFSLLLAREANLFVADSTFASELTQRLDYALLEYARELPADHWQQMPWYSRVLRWVSYSLIRLAVSLAGYGRDH